MSSERMSENWERTNLAKQCLASVLPAQLGLSNAIPRTVINGSICNVLGWQNQPFSLGSGFVVAPSILKNLFLSKYTCSSRHQDRCISRIVTVPV